MKVFRPARLLSQSVQAQEAARPLADAYAIGTDSSSFSAAGVAQSDNNTSGDMDLVADFVGVTNSSDEDALKWLEVRWI